MNPSEDNSSALKEIAKSFLKLGATAFGGPAAHIAMMEDEFVKKKNWLTHEHFLDLLGATNLIPGPNSTEMAIHIGYLKAKWKGLLTAGICFIFPATFITLIFAALYKLYGAVPKIDPFMIGIRSSIIAVIIAAVYRLSKPVVKDKFKLSLFAAVFILYLAGVDAILLLISAGVIGIIWRNKSLINNYFASIAAPLLAFVQPVHNIFSFNAGNVSLPGLFLFFLKIGCVLYGSGYVLVAYLQGGLVDTRHWITQSQLIDAIAIGQFTPGPVLSTATFIGYITGGLPGAALATAGIFLPSFLLVYLIYPFILRMRKSKIASGFLDGVIAASLGLMLSVSVILGKATLHSATAWIIFLAAGVILIIKNINSVWIVLGGAAAGWMLSFVM
jgi:chromate transporter